MNVEIITKKLELDLYGFSGIATDRDYAGTAVKLMDKMWRVVRSNGLGNKGRNIWVYENDHRVFAGVELDSIPDSNTFLERKSLALTKYAYYKHVGPYGLLKQVGPLMNDEIKQQGFEVVFPHIEIYGHWTNDENKLETESLRSLK